MGLGRGLSPGTDRPEFHVVAIDYGVKRNILRLLAANGCKVTVVPATTSAEDILALKPDGVFLSNGPGDPAATGKYAVPVIRQTDRQRHADVRHLPGPPDAGLALGARTMKMHQGHHGANHPVKDLTTGKVEIISMNHGFAVDRDSLPGNVEETHISLFDGTNCGLALKDRPVFSVQHHPEASPGPHDSHYLFRRFVDLMREQSARQRPDHKRNTLLFLPSFAKGRPRRMTRRRFQDQARCTRRCRVRRHDDAARHRHPATGGVRLQKRHQILNAVAELKSKFLVYLITFFVLGLRWLGNSKLAAHQETGDRPVRALDPPHLFLITCLPFSTMLIGRYDDLAPAVWIYAANMAFAALVSIRLQCIADHEGSHTEGLHEGTRSLWLLVASATFSVAVSFYDPG